MHPKVWITAALFLADFTAASADCLPPSTPFLTCSLRDHSKTLAVCINGASISYRYGPINGPAELALTQSAADVVYEPWPGIGRSIWEGVTFTNSGIDYAVYGAIDKSQALDNDPAAISGGVDVVKDGKTLASLQCDLGSVTFAYGTLMEQAKIAAGQCWNADIRQWQGC